MIEGEITPDGTPVVTLEIGGREITAIVDTGFNGDFELPEDLSSVIATRYIGPMTSLLAGGQVITEDSFEIVVDFDGRETTAVATFVGQSSDALLGTRILKHHRLEVDFPAGTLRLERTHHQN